MNAYRRLSRCMASFPSVRRLLLSAYRSGWRVLDGAGFTKPNLLQAIRVSNPGKTGFFGYHDKCPWDATGRYLLFLETDLANRMPGPDDTARICLADSQRPGETRAIGETRAWCWQQGCMLQWVGETQGILFNDYRKQGYCARIIDPNGNELKALPRPVYALSRDGTQALSMDFERIHHARPGYGYASRGYAGRQHRAPADNGIWRTDLQTGECTLIVSLARLARFKARDDFNGAFHYALHAEFNPGGTRFCFLHRWFPDAQDGQGTPHTTRMYTVDPEGRELRLREDSGFVSHFSWWDDAHLLATSRHAGLGFNYHLYHDTSDEVSILGKGVLTSDGHPSFSPSEHWLLTDTYPDATGRSTLILYDLPNSRRVDLGRYHVPPAYSGPLRCDLHPRWNRDGTLVCFDSVHEGTRAVYTVDVSPFMDGVL